MQEKSAPEAVKRMSLLPQQVWQTLTLAQQEIVFQKIVQACRYLALEGNKEGKNEHQAA